MTNVKAEGQRRLGQPKKQTKETRAYYRIVYLNSNCFNNPCIYKMGLTIVVVNRVSFRGITFDLWTKENINAAPLVYRNLFTFFKSFL
jgi:hypothetical protein